jgi:hypothetical protein
MELCRLDAIRGKFLPLVSACLDWRRENPLHLLHEKTLRAALQTNNFKAICSIHKDFFWSLLMVGMDPVS